MTQISFHPVKGDLSLVAVFRAQYTDAKGFGNLYSLAELLRKTASETGFDPAQLYSVAQKPILKYRKSIARQFHLALMLASSYIMQGIG